MTIKYRKLKKTIQNNALPTQLIVEECGNSNTPENQDTLNKQSNTLEGVTMNKEQDKLESASFEKRAHVFDKIETISITNKTEKPSIRINGKKAIPYDTHGVMLLASQIEALEINSLGYFNPIIIEFDDSAAFQKYPLLDTVVVALWVYDEQAVHAQITFMDPNDISREHHETYQLALDNIVKNNHRMELVRPTQVKYTKKEIQEHERVKKQCEAIGKNYTYSDVGHVCFGVFIAGLTYGEVFEIIGRTITLLDKKTRKAIKGKISR